LFQWTVAVVLVLSPVTGDFFMKVFEEWHSAGWFTNPVAGCITLMICDLASWKKELNHIINIHPSIQFSMET
jgi:hypothetical protein